MGRSGVFFHSDVEIGAAETEGGNIGAADAVLLPRLRLCYHAEQVQVYSRIGVHAIYGSGQGLVVEGERGFSYPHGAGRGLGVAYLRLYRGKPQFLPRAHVRAEHFLEHLHFRGVSDLGGRAVRFHEIHVRGGIIHPGKGVLNGYFLALRIGGGYALALAVGRRAHGVHQGVDLVAVPHGVGQALQYINGDRLRHHEAVGPLVEGVGAVRGQRAYLAELDESRGRHHLVGSPRHRHIELPGPQAQHRVVQGRHRGGAGRVHGHVGPVEVENIGYTAGRHVGQLARHGVFGYF